MFRIFRNIAFLGVAVIATLVVVDHLLPDFWGSETTYSRFSIDEDEIAASDILFFGSSRTLYHINGRLFSNRTKTKAYNLGIQQGRLLEINAQIRQFVKEHPVAKGRKKILYELTPIEKLQPKVMHTNRIKYFWNLKTLKTFAKYNWIDRDYREIGRGIQTYLEHLFKTSLVKEYYLLHALDKRIETNEFYGAAVMKNCRGCVMNGNDPISVSKKKTNSARERRKRIKIAYKRPVKLNANEQLKTEFILKEIDALRDEVNAYGYDMIIINQTGPQKLQVAIYDALLDKGYKGIDMGDPKEYPEFYNPDNMFDIAHLTRKAATDFTAKISVKYNKL